MSIYDKNLSLLTKKNPLLAFQILIAKAECAPYSRPASFPATDAQIAYIIGVGDEEWCKQALRWVKADNTRSLVLLEREAGGFREFFSLKIAEKVVNHPNITLALPPFEGTLKSFIRSHLCQPWECIGDAEIKDTITDLVLQMEGMLCLYRDFGIPQLMNVFSNLLSSKNVRSGEALFGQFANIPAIICGAGPSLENHLAQLKGLENRALIFGGGSALVPLSENGVPFHFAVALDPTSSRRRFSKYTHYEPPLFYQNQLSHSFFVMNKAPKLCLGENGSFPLEKWLNLPLSYCDVGWNVATFATQIAYRLGCDPIVFVGMDLSVSNEKAYAGNLKELRDNPIMCRDRYGNKVATRLDFFMAKRWLESFARAHVERTFLNATTGGVTLEGIKDVPLNLTSSSYDLKSKVHQATMEAPFLDLSHLPKKLREIKESVNQCLNQFLDNLTSFREMGLENEPFYRYHLLPLWDVWKHLLQTEQVVAAMQDPVIEKRVQRIIFLKKVTEDFKAIYDKRISV